MGVSLEVWRARCGVFNGVRLCKMSSPSCTCAENSIVILLKLFATLSILLIIGNIEINPGPSYKCRLCPEEFQSVQSHVAHQQFHQNESNFCFRCPHPTCIMHLNFRNLPALYSHLTYYHKNQNDEVENGNETTAGTKFSCNLQGCDFTAVDIKSCVHHGISHLKKNENILCIFGNCPHKDEPFTAVKTYRVHLSQYHPGWVQGVNMDLPSQKSNYENNEEMSENHSIADDGFDGAFETMSNHEEDPSQPEVVRSKHLFEDDDTVVKYIARFYLLLQADKNVPASIVQEVSKYITKIAEITQARIKSKISELFQKFDIPENELTVLLYQIQSSDPLYATHHASMPGPNLMTDYYRMDFYKKYFGHVDPLEIGLSVDRQSENKTQYVPLEETLTNMLKDPSIQKQVDESFQQVPSEEDKLNDYTDGKIMVRRNLSGEKTIDLILFQDGFSVVSPIGSAKNKYKLLGTYLTLGNLKPWIRSKISAMRLVTLFKEPLIKKLQILHNASGRARDPTAGVRKCFNQFLIDLKKLVKDGIMYKGSRVKVRLTHILGDNLGSHMIGGFRQYFTSGHVCRFCPFTLEKFKRRCADGVRVLTGKLRCRAHYDRCVFRARALKKGCHSYGIKHDSIFNGVGDYHAIDGLPPCLAHDFYLGCGSEDLALILKALIDKQWFTVDFLNRRIKLFKFTKADLTNRPAPFSNKKEKKTRLKLGGHAVQNWTLIRFLPYLIGDKVKDVTDPTWELYLSLKELCEIISSPSFSINQLNYLKHVIIPSYFDARVEAFGSASLTSKHHLICHYPDLIMKYGPLFYLWTLRFESFHSYFKTVARHNNNFINVERSLALKYQLRMCYLSTGEIFPEDTIFSRSESFLNTEQLSQKETKAVEGKLTQNAVVLSSISVNGLLYQEDDMLLLNRIEESDNFYIGQIARIFCDGDVPFLLLKEAKAIYNRSFGIHQIRHPLEENFLLEKF